MNYTWTFRAAGGLGIIGRFAIAMCILLVLKKIKGNDTDINKGIKWLIFAGIVALVLSAVVSLLFMVLFGIGMVTPFYYFH